MKTDEIVKFVPLIAIAAIGASICFDAGVFNVIGLVWMSSLTLQDLISLAWTSVPFFLILAIPLLIQQALTLWPGLFHDPIPSSGLADRLVTAGLMIVLPALPLFVTLLYNSSYDDRLAEALPWLNYSSILVLSTRSARYMAPAGLDFSLITVVVATLACAITIYSTGIAYETENENLPGKDQIRLIDKSSVCGRVLYIGERGVIISTENMGARVFFPTGEFQSVSHDKSCKG